MRVLVTGAAGFLGTQVVRRLITEGMEVVAFDRRAVERPRAAAENVLPVQGDVTFAGALARAADGCGAVVHLAALLPQRKRPPQEMQAVNVGGTRAAVEAARAAGARRFVFCSSAEVYGVPASPPIREDGPIAPNGEYGRNKVAAEEAVRSSGLEWVIFRPPTIVGPGMPEPLLTRMLDAVAAGRPVLVPGGATRFQMVDAEDVAEAILLGLTRPKAVGGTFNLGADAVPTGLELARAIKSAAGSSSAIVRIPGCLARPVLASLAAIRLGPLEPEHVQIAFSEYTFDTRRAADVLGWRPRRALADSFAALARAKRSGTHAA